MGRWIALEAQANPGFLEETIKGTLDTLQSRINAMAPAYDEHIRKGRTVGYSWREACRLAGVEHPDKLLALMIATGRARKTHTGHTELHPDYHRQGYVKAVKLTDRITTSNGGHLFKVTAKGLQEWLRGKAETMNQAVKADIAQREEAVRLKAILQHSSPDY